MERFFKREMLIVLEDLDSAGFSQRKRNVSQLDVENGLDWLANFHASFVNENPDGLWKPMDTTVYRYRPPNAANSK